jgi:hypothetical protein
MIDGDAAKRLKRLRFLWDRFKHYEQNDHLRSYTRAKRVAYMHMELDYRFRCEMGGNITPGG